MWMWVGPLVLATIHNEERDLGSGDPAEWYARRKNRSLVPREKGRCTQGEVCEIKDFECGSLEPKSGMKVGHKSLSCVRWRE